MRNLFTLLVFAFTLTLISANDPAPVITNITVDPVSDEVTVNWKSSGSLDIKHIRVFKSVTDNNGNELLDTVGQVSSSATSYIYTPKNGKEIASYKVIEYYTPDESNQQPSATSHTNMMVSVDEISEELKTVTLSWNAYEGWDEISIYRVYDATTNELKATIENGATSATIIDLSAGIPYRFYVQASGSFSNGEQYFSSSFGADVLIPGQKDPAYIKAAGTVDGTTFNMVFDIDPASEITTYDLFRVKVINPNREVVQRFENVTATRIEASDSPRYLDDRRYKYYLQAEDKWGNYTVKSDSINNIVLSASSNPDMDTVHDIEWNSYKPSMGSYSYDLVRTFENTVDVTVPLTDTNNYSLSFKDARYILNEGMLCYYVETQDQDIADFTVRSNVDCIIMRPKMKIATAIAPKSTSGAQEFRPIFEFQPEEYFLLIYNKWGTKVYETSDYNKPWLGKDRNSGKFVPEGVYIYSIKAVTHEGEEYFENGSVTVVYP